MSKPRVLVVATWLPTAKNPSLGAFCQRDIQALSTVADIRVLHVAAPHVDDGVRRTWIHAAGHRIPVLRLPLRPKSVPDMMRIIQAIRSTGQWADLVHSMAVSALLPVALARFSSGFSPIVASEVGRVWDFLIGQGQTSHRYEVGDRAGNRADIVNGLRRWMNAGDSAQHRVAAMPWIHTEHWSGFVQDTPVPRAVGLLEALPDRVVAVSEFLADRLRQASRRDVEVVGNIVQVPEPTPRRDLTQILRGGPKARAEEDRRDASRSQTLTDTIAPQKEPAQVCQMSQRVITRPGATHTAGLGLRRRQVIHVIGVGGLIDGKRPLLALEAVALLRARGVGADLTWVGGGELANAMRRKARAQGVPMTLTGAVTPAEVARRLSQADVMVLPTRAETFCLAAGEALASGRPVVVGARGGQRDFVHPPAGRLVASDDPHVWADAVLQTLRASAHLSAWDIAADVRERFSPTTWASAYQAQYKKLFSSRVAASGGLQRSTRQSPNAHQEPVMVFHAPFALDEHATSASGIRPVQMRRAFKEAGFTVIDVSGTAKQRRRRIKNLSRFLATGGRVDFAYSESATLPTALSGRPGHWPIPVGDLALYAILRRYHVPTGVFYRDIYWRFPDYRRSVGALAFGTVPLYLLDLAVYRLCQMRVYVPSLEMARYVPWVRRAQFEPLPPGTSIVPSGGLEHATRQEQAAGFVPSGSLQRSTRQQKQSLRGLGQDRASVRLLYVGGLGAHYRMHLLVAAVAGTPGTALTICTREEAWHSVFGEYQAWVAADASTHAAHPNASSIHIVHQSGAGLEPLYQQATVASLVVEPEQYRSFAMPFKLFEYLGHGLPILATAGTMAGDFVQEHHVGWTVEYDQDRIKTMLQHLAKHPEEILEAARAARAVAQQNTWTARTRQVATDLRGFSTAFAKRGRFDSRSILSGFRYPSHQE